MKINNFTWNKYSSLLEDINDSFNLSKDNHKIISFYSISKLEENKDFIKNINKFMSQDSVSYVLDIEKDKLSNYLKKLYSFLNQCIKYQEKTINDIKKLNKYLNVCFDYSKGDYVNNLTYEKLDKLFGIINSLDANFVMIELKKINKDFDNYKNFMKTLTKKRNIYSKLANLDKLAIDINRFLKIEIYGDYEEKAKLARKINSKFKCIPKEFKDDFMNKHQLPDNLLTRTFRVLNPNVKDKSKSLRY